jgi:hypothetical protein
VASHPKQRFRVADKSPIVIEPIAQADVEDVQCGCGPSDLRADARPHSGVHAASLVWIGRVKLSIVPLGWLAVAHNRPL